MSALQLKNQEEIHITQLQDRKQQPHLEQLQHWLQQPDNLQSTELVLSQYPEKAQILYHGYQQMM